MLQAANLFSRQASWTGGVAPPARPGEPHVPAGVAATSPQQELGEVTRITKQVHALIDSERTTAGAPLAKDRADFVQGCQNVGIDCRVLDRRATENYLTDVALKAALGNNYQALTPYQELKTTNPGWSKSDNWRVARMMSIPDLDGTDLGQFLESL
jgi:hypothetical protein